ncbi:MAG: VOC family protein, partial [Bacteroidota bacterium]
MKQFWLNLPVKDISKSIEFFTHLGFTFNTQRSSPNSACLVIGEKDVVVMLFDEPTSKVSLIMRQLYPAAPRKYCFP